MLSIHPFICLSIYLNITNITTSNISIRQSFFWSVDGKRHHIICSHISGTTANNYRNGSLLGKVDNSASLITADEFRIMQV